MSSSKVHSDILYKICERDNLRKTKNEERVITGKNQLYDAFRNEVDLITNIKQLNLAENKLHEIKSNFSAGETALITERVAKIKELFFKNEREKAKQNHVKFRFKKKQRLLLEGKGPSQTSSLPKNSQKEVEDSASLSFNNANQKTITAPGSYLFESRDLDVLITDVNPEVSAQPAIIEITPASTVHVKNCSNLIIKCTTKTSIFLEHVTNSTIHVTCQQLRMHHSRDLLVKVDCKSRSIIEDSSKITFARYDEDTEMANVENVDDFNWLSKETPSPNFVVNDDY